MSALTSPSLAYLVDVQFVQMPARAGEGTVLAEGEPGRDFLAAGAGLIFRERGKGHDAANGQSDPAPPVRRGGVPDVGESGVRRPAIECEGGRGNAPLGDRQFAVAGGHPDDRRRIVGKDARLRQQVDGQVSRLTDALATV